MGEVWTAQAEYSIDRSVHDVVQLTTSVSTPVTPATLTRTITLRAGEPSFTLTYALRNVGYQPFDYNWGIHPSLAVKPTWRFDIPATGPGRRGRWRPARQDRRRVRLAGDQRR